MATKIYCHICSWAPAQHDRWQCRPGCFTVWNTFDTHGCCPGCHKVWDVTQCLACAVTSLHEEWYHDDEQEIDRATEVAEREEVLVGA